MSNSTFWRLVALSLVFNASIALGADVEAKIVGVSDGDTVVAVDGKRNEVKIRMAGIDAPEFTQDFGTKGKQALSEKIFGKVVTVETQGEDKFGRILGTVKIGRRNINQEMVAEGWAWHYKQYDKSVELQNAEAKARQEKRGLWADNAPVPPWEFRKTKE